MSKETAPARYHPIHAALHWLMFLFVVMMLGIGKIVLPGISVDDPLKPFVLQMHAFAGFFIMILLAARVWSFVLQRNAPPLPMQEIPF